MAADDLQTSVDGSISVNRDLTTLALLRLLTAASVLWLAIQLCRNASRAIQFMMAFVAISSAYAAYGLITFALVQSENTSSPSFVTSTFYNHNHYATYAGMGLVAAFGLIARIYQRDMVTDGGSLRFRIATFIDVTGQKALVLLGGAFLLLVAVILTESRGGIIATGLGVIVWAALTFGRSQRASIERRMIMIFVSAVVAGVFVTFGDTFFGKMAEVGLADSNRIGVYIITLRSILDEPLLGYGYGTFADIFPMFRDRSIDVQGVWEQAHNTYLEVFQGLGLIFGSMLVASVVLLVLKCCKGAMARQQITVPCIATGVAFLVGVHAMVDFSLQMQAVALTFMAILGAGVAQSESSQLARQRLTGRIRGCHCKFIRCHSAGAGRKFREDVSNAKSPYFDKPIPTAIRRPRKSTVSTCARRLGFLWRQWIFIASILGAVLFVSAVYVYSETPRYTASAQVLLEMQQEMAGKKMQFFPRSILILRRSKASSQS